MVTLYWKIISTGYIGHGSHISHRVAFAWVRHLRVKIRIYILDKIIIIYL